MVFKPEKKYSWAEGFISKVGADVVGKVVEEIEQENGVVTRELFLEASRDEKAPTHCLFDWDNESAAEKYRLDQSRHIINHLKVEIIESDSAIEYVVPAFMNVTNDQKATYQNIVTALADQESRELILERLRREVDQLVARNKHIEGFAEILLDAYQKLTA